MSPSPEGARCQQQKTTQLLWSFCPAMVWSGLEEISWRNFFWEFLREGRRHTQRKTKIKQKKPSAKSKTLFSPEKLHSGFCPHCIQIFPLSRLLATVMCTNPTVNSESSSSLIWQEHSTSWLLLLPWSPIFRWLMGLNSLSVLLPSLPVAASVLPAVLPISLTANVIASQGSVLCPSSFLSQLLVGSLSLLALKATFTAPIWSFLSTSGFSIPWISDIPT